MLVSPAEAVVVGRFEVPAESVLGKGPEHEIERRFGRGGVCRDAADIRVNPTRARRPP